MDDLTFKNKQRVGNDIHDIVVPEQWGCEQIKSPRGIDHSNPGRESILNLSTGC